MLLSNFYKIIQSYIRSNSQEDYVKVKDRTGKEMGATLSLLTYNVGTSMLDSYGLYSNITSMSDSNYGYVLGCSDAELTADDYTLGTLNADISVTALTSENSVIANVENHTVTSTFVWSITNTSTTLSVECKEIGYFSRNILLWRELLGDKSFTLQPLQAGKFTMVLTYNYVNYSLNTASIINEIL